MKVKALINLQSFKVQSQQEQWECDECDECDECEDLEDRSVEINGLI